MNTGANKQPSEAKAVNYVKTFGNNYRLDELSPGDCVEINSKQCMLIGKSSRFYHVLFQDGSTEGFYGTSEVTYKGKGKLSVEFAKEPALEDIAKQLDHHLLADTGLDYHFISVNNGYLTVYYNYNHSFYTLFTTYMNIPVVWVDVKNRILNNK